MFVFNIILAVVSILLIAAVLLQPKAEGVSLTGMKEGSFGKFEKRGAEKTLHIATIVLATLFGLLVFAAFLLA